MMESGLQIIGALMILSAYISVQTGHLLPNAYLTLTLNAVGAGLLACLALLGENWGFLLLEGCWAVVSVWGLGVRYHRRPSQT